MLRQLMLAVAALPLVCGAVEVDGIAAKVNGETILKSDVFEEMHRRGIADLGGFAAVRNDLVERKLILKAAVDAKLTMQDWLVENRVREIVERNFGGDRNRLMDVLARQKLSYAEWRKRMHDDLVVQAMRWNTIEKNVSPSPAQMREEYAAHPERYQLNSSVTVSVILLRPEDAAKRAEVEKALKSKPFAEVARSYSADSRAKDGGLWKDVNPEEVFRDEVSAEIAKMPKGTLSPWVEIDGWSFLLKKDDERISCQRSFREAYDDIFNAVAEREAARLYAAWIERLKRASYVKLID